MGDLGNWGIVHLLLVIYAAVQILGSSAEHNKKIIWTLIVEIIPLFGLIIWYMEGPVTPKKRPCYAISGPTSRRTRRLTGACG